MRLNYGKTLVSRIHDIPMLPLRRLRLRVSRQFALLKIRRRFLREYRTLPAELFQMRQSVPKRSRRNPPTAQAVRLLFFLIPTKGFFN